MGRLRWMPPIRRCRRMPKKRGEVKTALCSTCATPALAIPEAGWKKAPGDSLGMPKVGAGDLDNDRGPPHPAASMGQRARPPMAELGAQLRRRLQAAIERVDIRRLMVGDFPRYGDCRSGAPAGGWRADIHAARRSTPGPCWNKTRAAPPRGDARSCHRGRRGRTRVLSTSGTQPCSPCHARRTCDAGRGRSGDCSRVALLQSGCSMATMLQTSQARFGRPAQRSR